MASWVTAPKKYKLTMSEEKVKQQLLEGFKIGSSNVKARKLNNSEEAPSFLHLLVYTTDDKILAKLHSCEMSPASHIKR